VIYLGSYTAGSGEGVGVATMRDGALRLESTAPCPPRPSYLALAPDGRTLYAAHDQPLQGLRHPPRKAVNPPMPDMKLDAADAAELAEILQFLSGWLARDPARLGASLDDFAGHPAYGISQVRQDLERFVFLLGGSDGEPLFGHPPS